VLIFLLGGARSGKSVLAIQLASVRAGPATFIATAEPLDDEMTARIALHRSERPGSWATVEEPLAVEEALGTTVESSVVVIDCLTLWVANQLGAGDDDNEILARAGRVAAGAAERSGHVIVVSNEVGSGIVPTEAVSRRYRDLLGRVNAVFAGRASQAFLVVAGRVLPLLALEDLAGAPRP
jgi:adenosyl cobinamide kinase/adenosyl cobinamide phosphate guanylyltransferase